jgi:acyl-CoA reductase-like NAD-dependent aldehyde dehydrogenase
MLKIVNPATEEVIEQLTEDTPATVAQKFEKLREGQRRWAKAPLETRVAALRKFRDLVVEKKTSSPVR